MPAPAPCSTRTSWPCRTTSFTLSGVRPTRYSWSLISFVHPDEHWSVSPQNPRDRPVALPRRAVHCKSAKAVRSRSRPPESRHRLPLRGNRRGLLRGRTGRMRPKLARPPDRRGAPRAPAPAPRTHVTDAIVHRGGRPPRPARARGRRLRAREAAAPPPCRPCPVASTRTGEASGQRARSARCASGVGPRPARRRRGTSGPGPGSVPGGSEASRSSPDDARLRTLSDSLHVGIIRPPSGSCVIGKGSQVRPIRVLDSLRRHPSYR